MEEPKTANDADGAVENSFVMKYNNGNGRYVWWIYDWCRLLWLLLRSSATIVWSYFFNNLMFFRRTYTWHWAKCPAEVSVTNAACLFSFRMWVLEFLVLPEMLLWWTSLYFSGWDLRRWRDLLFIVHWNFGGEVFAGMDNVWPCSKAWCASALAGRCAWIESQIVKRGKAKKLGKAKDNLKYIPLGR